MSTVSEKQDITELFDILSDYCKETGSELAGKIIKNYEAYLPSFKKIIPKDYQHMLHVIAEFEEKGMKYGDAELEAFMEIKKGAK